MGQVIVDNIDLLEPNLRIPGKKPVGQVKVDWSHSIPSTYQLLSAYLFRSPDYTTTVDAAAQPMILYDAAQERRYDVIVDNPVYWKFAQDNKGMLLKKTGAGAARFLFKDADPFNVFRWNPILTNDSYTILGSGVLHSVASLYLADTTVQHLQYISVSFSATSQTMRCINKAQWSASYDEVFSLNLAVGDELFWGVSWDRGTGYRGAHLGNQVRTRTNFTGSGLSTTGAWNIFRSLNSISPRYLFVFAKSLPAHIVDEVRLDPYQFLIPSLGAGLRFIGAKSLAGPTLFMSAYGA